MTLKQPIFVTLEGLNASGKSTMQERLAEAITGGKIPGFDRCVTTREIGGTPVGERIRELFVDPNYPIPEAVTELLLINAARREHLKQVIVPALHEPGTVILCDRYIASTVAYQHGYKGLRFSLIEGQHRLFCENIYPDLTIFLEISPQTSIRRTQGREYPIPDTQKNIERLEAIAQGYRDYGNIIMKFEKKGGEEIERGRWHQLNGLLRKGMLVHRCLHLISEHSEKKRTTDGIKTAEELFGTSKELPC